MNQNDPFQPDQRTPPPLPPPLPTLGYGQPGPSPFLRKGDGAPQFFLGLIDGSVLSGAVYVPLMMDKHSPEKLGPILVSTVILLKIGAIIWAFVVRRKALGAGLLTSVPIAVMIFVVGCFTAVLQNMH